MTKSDMHMEDASTIALAAMASIERDLAKFGIAIPAADEDKLFKPIIDFLEGLSNGNYRHDH